MSNDNVVKLIQPGILTDRLTEVLRDGARALLTQAVEAEVSEFLAATADLKTDDGCRRVVRHGHLPERQIMTGIGPVAVRQPRVRDREAGADDPARIRFTPAILPPYARRSKSLDTLIPILYLKGVSTGDFASALAALLGKDAPGLSATTIARLKEVSDRRTQAMERARPFGQELRTSPKIGDSASRWCPISSSPVTRRVNHGASPCSRQVGIAKSEALRRRWLSAARKLRSLSRVRRVAPRLSSAAVICNKSVS